MSVNITLQRFVYTFCIGLSYELYTATTMRIAIYHYCLIWLQIVFAFWLMPSPYLCEQ